MSQMPIGAIRDQQSQMMSLLLVKRMIIASAACGFASRRTVAARLGLAEFVPALDHDDARVSVVFPPTT